MADNFQRHLYYTLGVATGVAVTWANIWAAFTLLILSLLGLFGYAVGNGYIVFRGHRG